MIDELTKKSTARSSLSRRTVLEEEDGVGGLVAPNKLGISKALAPCSWHEHNSKGKTRGSPFMFALVISKHERCARVEGGDERMCCCWW